LSNFLLYHFFREGEERRGIKGEISLPIQYILIFDMFNVMKKAKTT
jgi:hypothetical protein